MRLGKSKSGATYDFELRLRRALCVLGVALALLLCSVALFAVVIHPSASNLNVKFAWNNGG